jgi:hypothetical protein
MLGPNTVTRDLATQAYNDRLSHAARIQLIKRDRSEEHASLVDRVAARRVTVTRLAATAVAAGAALAALTATTMAASPSVGGGATFLIR